MSSYTDSNISNFNNKGFLSKILRNISNWGMESDEIVIRNTNAVQLNHIPQQSGQNADMYDIISQNKIASMMQFKSFSYLDKSYAEKVRILREYSRKDEISEFLTKVSDEAIYSSEEQFCTPIPLTEEFNDDVQRKYNENFKNIMNKFGFNANATHSWNLFRKFLIDGYLAFEIVYDDKCKNIIKLNQLDPSTLVPSINPVTHDSIWIQFPDNPAIRHILLDSQIIYISYSAGTEYSEVSYVENLIRPFNQLKLLEQTRIMFNVMNAMINRVYTLPVSEMSRDMAEEQLSKFIMENKDEISFNEEYGIVTLNGSPHITYNKDIYLTEGVSGKPTVDNLEFKGHNLNENDMLTYFYNAFKRASKIPFTRFDKTTGGGNIFDESTNQVSRDELHYFYFVERLRTVFKEIIIKPWKIKMILDFPELENDENFLSKINVKFNGTNLFYDMKKNANTLKQIELITQLQSIKDSEEKQYFHTELLVKEYMKLDEDFMRENERYKKQGTSVTSSNIATDEAVPEMSAEAEPTTTETE